jgi:hypothetical protein
MDSNELEVEDEPDHMTTQTPLIAPLNAVARREQANATLL